MAVSSNPSCNQSYQPPGGPPQTAAGNSVEAAMPSVLNGNDAQQYALKHDPGISVDWSAEEQSILEENLSKYASESSINKYIKVAALLPEKTVRDVALRYRWMLKKDKRKAEDQNLPKKINKKDKPVEPKTATSGVRASTASYTAPLAPLESDDGIPSEAIAEPARQLLEQNAQIISQIKANLAACKVQENLELLGRFRDNIFTISNSIKEIPGIINEMPQLPVMVNMELIEAVFPKSNS